VICVHFEQAWRRDEKPRIEEYLTRGSADIRNLLFRELLAHELELRQEAGEAPELVDYQERFPDLHFHVDAAFTSAVNGIHHATRQAISARVGRRYRVESELGIGAFGAVLLAKDLELDRFVALKVPRLDRFWSERELGQFTAEARAAAQLEHPGIVAVYDVIQDRRGVVIVQQYIQGIDLDTLLKRESVPAERVAAILRQIAETMAFAHRRGYVHRDLKPKNILLDQDGAVHVADFGLAMRISTRHILQGERAGTPAYMSPEQFRGESHRLDGRSDIWSIGVIAYEMLTGQRPFCGDNLDALSEDIQNRPASSLSAISPQIPVELERICLKCLSKRATDRYADANELKDDLQSWLNEGDVREVSDEKSSAIIPKGLRTFDGEDREFFLRLLPGVRDRHGLPEVIRFWKTRVEATDAEASFTVGLIYGPSGCGKSSIVRAGLIPHLGSHVIPIYVAATDTETDARIAGQLRQQFPGIPENASLAEILGGLREGRWLPLGKKALLFIDQLEQWLQDGQPTAQSTLICALRQCDGKRVQALLLVRDDYWAGTTRLMQAIEVDLVEGQNCRMVDLFDLEHARDVLGEFGRAYARLPDDRRKTTRGQETFLTRSVSELAQHGRVICVRIALFADMMKGKDWEPSSLKSVGGAEGLGLAFLDDAFSAASAPMRQRAHQQAVRNVLATLLPDEGSLLKGHLRSHRDLLAASGYEARPDKFREVLRLLDQETRLITPVEAPESPDNAPHGAPCDTYYQLTHDYLVRSVRDWLTRRQKETIRGRAELALADRAALWSQRREDRRLPSLFEFLRIICFTRWRQWQMDEKALMQRARNFYGFWGVMLLLVAGAVSWFGVTSAITRADVNRKQAELQQEQEEMRAKEEIASYFAATRDVEFWLADADPRKKAEVLTKISSAARTDAVVRDDIFLRSLGMRALTVLGISSPTPIRPAKDFHGRSIAASPDGRLWAIGQYRGSKCLVRVVESATQLAQDLWVRGATVNAGDNGIVQVAFSPDGRWLAGCSELGYVQVWEVDKLPDNFATLSGPPNLADGLASASIYDVKPELVIGGGVASWKAHQDEVSSLCFSPDGSMLATTSVDGTLACWTVGTWQQCFSHRFEDAVSSAAFHHSGGYLVCGTNADAEVVYLDKEQPPFADKFGLCRELCFLGPKSALAVLAEAGLPLRILDCEKRQLRPQAEWFPYTNTMRVDLEQLVVGLNGTFLLGQASDGKLWIWSTISARPLAQLEAPGAHGISIRNDELLVVHDQEAFAYQLDAPVESFAAFQSSPVRSFCFRHDGNLLATASVTASDDRQIQVAVWTIDGTLYGRHDFKFERETGGSTLETPAMTFLQDHLLAVGFGGEVKVLRCDDGSLPTEFAYPEVDSVKALAFSPQDNGTLLVADGDQLKTLTRRPQDSRSFQNFDLSGRIALSGIAQNGLYVATSDREGHVSIWRWQGGELHKDKAIRAQPGATFESNAVALSRDGQFLAMGDNSGFLRVVTMPDAVNRLALRASSDRIMSVAFGETAVGQFLAVGSRDGLLRLWGRYGDTFEEIFTWKSPSEILQVAFSPDGTTLAFIASGERAVHFWDLETVFGRLEDLGLGWKPGASAAGGRGE